MHRSSVRITAVFFAAVLLLFVAFCFVINPVLNQQRPRLEHWLGQVLAQPVRMSGVSVSWHGLSPTVEFLDVVILNDTLTHSLLKVKRVYVRANILSSLYHRQFVLGNLFMFEPELTLRQDAEQRWSIDGLRGIQGGELSELKELKTWLSAERKIFISNLAVKSYFSNGQFFSAFAQQVTVSTLKGNIQFQGQLLDLNLEGFFRDHIILDEVTGNIDTQTQENRIQFHNADLNFQGIFKLSPESIIDLTGEFNLLRPNNKFRYLPVSILSPKLVNWLDTAIPQAKQASGKIILRGNMRDFPFDDPVAKLQGEFKIDAQIFGVTLAYEQGWPPIRDLNVQLLFSGRRMEITADNGKILNGQIQQAKAIIPDLDADIPILSVTGLVVADSSDGLAFIKQSPLQEKLGADIANLALQGPMHGTLALQVPLEGSAPTTVIGKMTLTNNQLTELNAGLTATQLQGLLEFTQDTLNATGLTAQFLGEQIRIDLKQPEQSDIVLATVVGQVSPKKLLKERGFSESAYFSEGKINYKLLLSFAPHSSQKKSSLVATSDLKGLGINLPESLGKAANTTKQTEVKVAFDSTKYLSLLVKYGPQINAKLQYDKQGKTYKFASAQIRFNGPMLVGYIDSPARPGAPWDAVFTSLRLTGISDRAEAMGGLKLKDIPAIRVTASDFQYKNKRLGRLKLRIEPMPQGLEIRTLVLDTPSFTLTANGTWQAKGTHLVGHMSSQNILDALKRWGMPATITGQSANLAFDLNWPGAAYDPQVKTLQGTFNLQIKNGQIMDIGSNAAAQMGLGRILTMLSLQTLQRRLKLDFSDLGNTGFTFDFVQGQFTLRNGNAYTNNMQISGPVARVKLNGRIGMSAEDYDLNLTITPHLTASLPVLAAILGGPVVGLAVWTADKVLGSTVRQMTAREYKMQGSWSQPKVTLVGTLPVPADEK